MYCEKVDALCADDFLNVTLKDIVKIATFQGHWFWEGAFFCLKYCGVSHFYIVLYTKSAIKDLESDAITNTNK